jgi:hypothetical protein
MSALELKEEEEDNSLIDAIACGQVNVIKRQSIPDTFFTLFKEFRRMASQPFLTLKEIRKMLLEKREFTSVWRKLNEMDKMSESVFYLDKKKKKNDENLFFGYRLVVRHDVFSISNEFPSFVRKSTGGYIEHEVSVREYNEISKMCSKLLEKFVLFQKLLQQMLNAFEMLYNFCTNPTSITLEILDYLAGYCGDVNIIEKLFIKWDAEFERQKVTKSMLELENSLLLLIGDFLVPVFGNKTRDTNSVFIYFNKKELDSLHELLVHDFISSLLDKMNYCLSTKFVSVFSEIWTMPKLKNLF